MVTGAILTCTTRGWHRFRRCLDTPVDHLSDLRSELLLEIVLAPGNGIDSTATRVQRARIAGFLSVLDAADDAGDVVQMLGREAATATLRILDRLTP